MNIARLKRELDRSDAPRRDRRRSRAELGNWRERHRVATLGVAAVVAPESARLNAEEDRLTGRLAGLGRQQVNHRDWVAEHPEAARRINDLATEIEALDERLERVRGVPERVAGLDPARPWPRPPVARERELGIDLGL